MNRLIRIIRELWYIPDPSDQRESAVFISHMRSLCSGLPTLNRINLIMPLVFAAGLVFSVPLTHLAMWLGAVYAMGSFRYLSLRKYTEHLDNIHDAMHAERYFAAANLLGGIIWGAAAPLFMSPDNLGQSAYVMVYLAGLVAGSVTVNAFRPKFHMLFTVPAIGLASYGALAFGLPYSAVIIAAAWLFVIIMATVSNQVYRDLKRGTEYGLRNLDLANELRNERDRAESARQAAERASSSKSDFVARTSHDIRTPLTGILGMADALARSELSEQDKEKVEAIRTSGSALLDLLNDILDISKIEAGKMALKYQSLTPAEFVHDLETIWGPQVREQGLSLNVELGKSLPDAIIVDKSRLRQIANNFIGNALKYTSEGSISLALVEDRLKDEQPGFKLVVADTGHGIPEEKLDNLFRAYSRVDSDENEEIKGTGLGLTISRQLAEIMGGTIGVESEEGSGSIFWVTLPVEGNGSPVKADTPRQPSAHSSQDSHTQQDKRPPLHILVAEDNEINRTVIRSMLESLGHSCQLVSNGTEAIDAIQEGGFDLCLMDIQMPVMGGIEATRKILAMDGAASATPIVALTGHAMEDDQKLYKAEGFADFVAKPIDINQLAEKLAKF